MLNNVKYIDHIHPVFKYTNPHLFHIKFLEIVRLAIYLHGSNEVESAVFYLNPRHNYHYTIISVSFQRLFLFANLLCICLWLSLSKVCQ